jgi:hypothetical protein
MVPQTVQMAPALISGLEHRAFNLQHIRRA